MTRDETSRGERWTQLGELLFSVAAGLEAVGAFTGDGEPLVFVSESAGVDDLLPTVRSLARRISRSSPLGPERPDSLSRATFTFGRRRLLLRPLAGGRGYVFLFGARESVTSSSWLLLDAVAQLGGALESQTR